MKFVIRVVVNAVALGIATFLLGGIRLTGSDKLLHLVIVAVIFGLVNAIVRPVVKVLTFPLIILTLGLLILVINAFMLLLTSWISTQIALGFHVDGFLTAVFGGIIVMVATWVLELVLPDGR